MPIILSNYKKQYLLYCIIHLYCSLQRSNPCLMLWEVKLCIQCNLSDFETKYAIVSDLCKMLIVFYLTNKISYSPMVL